MLTTEYSISKFHLEEMSYYLKKRFNTKDCRSENYFTTLNNTFYIIWMIEYCEFRYCTVCGLFFLDELKPQAYLPQPLKPRIGLQTKPFTHLCGKWIIM